MDVVRLFELDCHMVPEPDFPLYDPTIFSFSSEPEETARREGTNLVMIGREERAREWLASGLVVRYDGHLYATSKSVLYEILSMENPVVRSVVTLHQIGVLTYGFAETKLMQFVPPNVVRLLIGEEGSHGATG